MVSAACECDAAQYTRRRARGSAGAAFCGECTISFVSGVWGGFRPDLHRLRVDVDNNGGTARRVAATARLRAAPTGVALRVYPHLQRGRLRRERVAVPDGRARAIPPGTPKQAETRHKRPASGKNATTFDARSSHGSGQRSCCVRAARDRREGGRRAEGDATIKAPRRSRRARRRRGEKAGEAERAIAGRRRRRRRRSRRRSGGSLRSPRRRGR